MMPPITTHAAPHVRALATACSTPAMVATQTDSDFQTFIGNTIQVDIFNIWARESNRREALRDAPAEYKKVQDKVDDLRARQINRPQPVHH